MNDRRIGDQRAVHSSIEGVLLAKINNHSTPKTGQDKMQGLVKQTVSNQKQLQEDAKYKKQITGNNRIRNIIEQQQKEYTQAKPFPKKYGRQNSNPPTPLTSKPVDDRPVERNKQVVVEAKNRTKQSFNDRLASNIIKDECPATKNSFRVRKLDNRSPKKIREDLIVLNQEEQLIQLQIVSLHKKYRLELEQVKQNHQLSMNAEKIALYFKQESAQNQLTEDQWQILQGKINQLIRAKKKQLAKLQHRIQGNKYLEYLRNQPQDIEEINSTEEQQDIVQELPAHPVVKSQGSYSNTMNQLKSKKHALNLRLTYEIFKTEDKNQPSQTPIAQTQNFSQSGENRVTLNTKFKDFLLS